MNIEKKATLMAMCIAFFLATVKLVIGIYSGSMAVMSSAIDSLLDTIISLFNAIAIHNARKNPDENFNYGRGKMEPFAGFVEGIIILISAGYILFESIQKIFQKNYFVHFDIAFMVMLISFLVTGFLVFFLSRIAKKTKNMVIEADSLHYKTDLLTNFGIIFWMIIIYFSGWYIIDAIFGIIIAIYIAWNAIVIVKKWFLYLMDISLSNDEVEKICKILKDAQIENFHNFRTRLSGNVKFVEAHLVFHSDISLLEAHNIAHMIEDSIRTLDTESAWSILFHLDPYNDELEDRMRQNVP